MQRRVDENWWAQRSIVAGDWGRGGAVTASKPLLTKTSAQCSVAILVTGETTVKTGVMGWAWCSGARSQNIRVLVVVANVQNQTKEKHKVIVTVFLRVCRIWTVLQLSFFACITLKLELEQSGLKLQRQEKILIYGCIYGFSVTISKLQYWKKNAIFVVVVVVSQRCGGTT